MTEGIMHKRAVVTYFPGLPYYIGTPEASEVGRNGVSLGYTIIN